MELDELEVVCTMKDDVHFGVLYTVVVQGLYVVQKVFEKHTEATFVVTSANDSDHMDDSYHYDNLAFDVRTRNLSAMTIQKILKDCIQKLQSIDRHWDVVFEEDEYNKEGRQIKWQHFHFEFDIRKQV